MISEKAVEELIDKSIEGTSIFLISCSVRPGNVIEVLIDNMENTSVQDCMLVSRGIEHNLDREVEDFELSVSSPGLSKPFLVKKQYIKNIGRRVKVKTIEGEKFEGELMKFENDIVLLKDKVKERIEGRKSKQWVEKEYQIGFDNIKETKVIISFK